MKRKALFTAVSAITLAFTASCNQQAIAQTLKHQKEMKAVQFRIARPTNKLNEVVRFYQDALGLAVIGKFKDHSGYDGVMLGMPDKTYHLEFTQYAVPTPLPGPTKENLLVFYYAHEEEYKMANERIQRKGIMPVAPENPYWKDKSETYEDPDGWRIVLFNGIYNP